MSDVAIRVRDLGKQYKIGARRQRADTLRDVLAGAVKGVVGRFGANDQPAGDSIIWALRDVSFEVKRGEVLGVIGRNGAGKSTLLKILARITEPTTGEVELHGRVGSLLEVGTGFHAELSGRENIYLNGAILGIKRIEVQRRFDEIVDFAAVEQFIDTPVKHYSSGMYMRLAFAVAAHMDTEILLVDEVLAVGDVQFQNKCLGKMGEVARSGRTILFVSHNIEAIGRLCGQSLFIDKGQIAERGETTEVIKAYLTSTRNRSIADVVLPTGSDYTDIRVTINGQPPGGLIVLRSPNDTLTVIVDLECAVSIVCPRIDLGFYRYDALKLFAIQSDQFQGFTAAEKHSQWTVTFQLNELAMASQDTYFDLGIRQAAHSEYAVLWQHVAEIRVEYTGQHVVTPGSVVAPAWHLSIS